MTRTDRHNRGGMERLGLAAFMALAVTGMFLTAAQAAGDGKRHATIQIATAGDDAGEEFDVSDLAVGESRYLTTASGKEIEITRQQGGFRILLDGKEINTMIGDGTEVNADVMVMKGGGDATVRTMVVSGDGGNQWVTADGAHTVIDIDGDGGGVFISGLGDLDEGQRQRIIDALHAEGVEKDVHFAPGGPHAFHFRTEAGEEGEEGAHRIMVNRLHTVADGEDAGTREVIIIKTGDDEDQD